MADVIPTITNIQEYAGLKMAYFSAAAVNTDDDLDFSAITSEVTYAHGNESLTGTDALIINNAGAAEKATVKATLTAKIVQGIVYYV